MPTQKKRINIAVSDVIEEAVHQLAKRDKVPVATKARQLIEYALELEEDLYFGRLAAEREATNATYVSHKEAWKHTK